MSQGDRRFPSWQFIGTTALGIIGTLVLFAFADTREQIKNKADRDSLVKLESKVNSLEYRMNTFDDKLDMIIWMHVDKDGNPINKRR